MDWTLRFGKLLHNYVSSMVYDSLFMTLPWCEKSSGYYWDLTGYTMISNG